MAANLTILGTVTHIPKLDWGVTADGVIRKFSPFSQNRLQLQLDRVEEMSKIRVSDTSVEHVGAACPCDKNEKCSQEP